MSMQARVGAPFTIGAVFSHTFSIFGRGFGKFIVLALIPLLPLLVLQLLGVGARDPRALFNAGAIIIGLLTFVLGIIANATSLYGAFQEMRGERFTVGKSFGVGLARVVPIIGVSLLAGIATGLATLALVVPGLIVLCIFYVAVPACVVEQLGVMDSLKRSAALTKGFRWQIFAIVLIIVAIAAAGGAALAFFGITLLGLGVISTLISFVWQVIAAAFGAVLAAVIYHDLRVAKEGVDVSKMAGVFD